jgi:hypothetical protein
MSLEGSELYGDSSASMADSDVVDSLNSTVPMHQTGTKLSGLPKFKASSFRLTIKADFASAVDKGKRLKEHISERTVDSYGLVAIALLGYVQTKKALKLVRCRSGLRLLCGRRSHAAWRATLNSNKIYSLMQTILVPSSLHLEASV